MFLSVELYYMRLYFLHFFQLRELGGKFFNSRFHKSDGDDVTLR